jgi:hypothetical protein
MSHRKQDDDLVEPQGVNAGGAVDDEPTEEEPTGSAPEPPDRPLLDDEMVGLPEQKPGYPGQQRSIDTS